MSKARKIADLLDANGDVKLGHLDNVAGSAKNLIINGGMKISQRGDYTSATSITNGNYYLDRFAPYRNGASATVQQTDVTINGVNKKAIKVVATTTSTGYIGFYQSIELQNIPVGKTLIVSCWVRSNNSNTRFRTNDFRGVDTDGTAFTNDGNWEKVSWTFDSSSTTSNPTIWLITYNGGSVSVTSGDYLEVADLQLELGSVATDFEQRSYGEELALCQRYYEISAPANKNRYSMNIGNSASNHYPTVPFKVTKSGIPTVTITNDYNDNLTINGHSASTESFFMYVGNSGVNSRSLVEYHWTAQAEL
jgi:hypothetical protein